ncbi:hypothetical protein PLANPX_2730 [Lacipirellula parvula]|uniref:Uncharacterized protein n=1 Tax=Lacipirellula parvula TaxID=2650471 RepID=A0A5K7X996_9BACT|nr:hypothetical protein PLANPX_2730 [Lacipirellula parvula]
MRRAFRTNVADEKVGRAARAVAALGNIVQEFAMARLPKESFRVPSALARRRGAGPPKRHNPLMQRPPAGNILVRARRPIARFCL